MKTRDTGDYTKMAGQEFWYFLSGNEVFYTDMIELIGRYVKQPNDRYEEEKAALANRFTAEFASDLCQEGKIDGKSG